MSQDRKPISIAGTSSSEEASLPSLALGETKPGRPALVLIVWAISLIVLAGLAPVMQATMGLPFELLSLVMLAPAFACTVVLIVPSWMPEPWKRVGGSSVLLAAMVSVVAVVVFFVVLALATGSKPSLPASVGDAPLVLFLALQAVGALSEEIGWRGVVQRCGERFARPAAVSAIAGFLFGATHLGYWELGILPVLTFAFTAMLMSLTITAIFTGSFWQRMIPAVIVHLGLNLTITCLASGGEPIGTSLGALGAAAAMLIVAAIVKGLVIRRGR